MRIRQILKRLGHHENELFEVYMIGRENLYRVILKLNQKILST